MHRLAAAVVTLVVTPVALFGAGTGPARAAEIKCPGSPGCVISVAKLGDCWERPCSIALRLSATFSRDVTVRYATVGGTAVEGVDYQGVKDGFAKIPAGEKTGHLELTILADDIREADETFSLRFASPWDGFTVEPSTVRIVIHDGA